MTRATDTSISTPPKCHFREMTLTPEDTGAMTLEYHYQCSVCGNTKPRNGKAAK